MQTYANAVMKVWKHVRKRAFYIHTCCVNLICLFANEIRMRSKNVGASGRDAEHPLEPAGVGLGEWLMSSSNPPPPGGASGGFMNSPFYV
jgi:hypothetical protein